VPDFQDDNGNAVRYGYISAICSYCLCDEHVIGAGTPRADSGDLTPLDFFLRDEGGDGYVNIHYYVNRPRTVEQLKEEIRRVAGELGTEPNPPGDQNGSLAGVTEADIRTSGI